MTAFTTSQLPASVNTVEKLAFWAALVLQELNYNEVIQEQQNGVELPVASNTTFQIRTTDYTGPRGIMRVSVPMNVNYAAQARPWTGVLELSTTAIPTTYTT